VSWDSRKDLHNNDQGLQLRFMTEPNPSRIKWSQAESPLRGTGHGTDRLELPRFCVQW
jgi:hypothetical protein